MIDLRSHLGLSVSVPARHAMSMNVSAGYVAQEPQLEVPDAAEHLDWAYAELCRRSLADFVRESWHVLEPSTELDWGWHLQAVCDHVQWILEGWIAAKEGRPHEQKIRNAYFSLPPGSMKTRLIMECAPAWMWTRWPGWRVICLSRNPKRAQDSARNSRTIISSEWYQKTFAPEWTLRDDQDAVSDFGNTAGGARYSKGIVAEIVGSRADALLVDDPNAPDDDEDALARINALWDSTLHSRVNDLRISVRIIVQQRVRPNDLTGHLAGRNQADEGSENIGDWMDFVLPLEYDPGRACVTPFGWRDPRTEAGETIHPVRYTAKVVADMRRTLGRDFEAQANQNPSTDDSTGFPVEGWGWWRRLDRNAPEGWKRPEGARPDPALVVRPNPDGTLPFAWVDVSVDATFGSVNDGASHVGMVVLAGLPNSTKRLVVEDRGRGPRKFWQTVSDIKASVVSAVRLTGKRTITVVVEEKANGAAIIETLAKELKRTDMDEPVPGWQFKGGRVLVDGRPVLVKLHPHKPGQGSKEARAQAMEPDHAAGDVLLPEGASWIPPFLAEFKRFPTKPNDRVDSVAQDLDYRRTARTGWQDVFRRGPPVAQAPRDPEAPAECAHRWVEGRCIICGKSGS